MYPLERAENLQRELLAALAELPAFDDRASPGRRQQYAALGWTKDRVIPVCPPYPVFGI
jgi:hypothetical protein